MSLLSEDEVVWAYRLLLDREPESPEIISEQCQGHNTLRSLRESILQSEEYRQGNSEQDLSLARGTREPLRVDSTASDSELDALQADTAATRQRHGIAEPYWSTLNDERYRVATINEHLPTFLESGRTTVLDRVQLLEANGFDPSGLASVLEFGCGVGRLTLWLSTLFPLVHAYDISEPHLRIAQDLMVARDQTNIHWQLVEDTSSMYSLERAAFVYSELVLQQNTPPMIAFNLRRLLEAIEPGGVGLFQLVTFKPGYSFDLSEYLGTEHRAAAADSQIPVHVLPQRHAHMIISESGCNTLEVLETDTARSTEVSSMFLVQRPA